MKRDEWEESAGGALVRLAGGAPEVLVIRVRKEGFELPKGHIEPGEEPEEAARRELGEETGLINPPSPVEELAALEYSFPSQDGAVWVRKRVRYYLFLEGQGVSLSFGPRPERTREMRWVDEAAIGGLSLVSEDLRAVLIRALKAVKAHL